MGLDIVTAKLVDLAECTAMIEKHRQSGETDYVTHVEAQLVAAWTAARLP